MDEHGVLVDGLAAHVERFRPAFIGLNPHHHNPTGTRLSEGRRREVAELAGAYRVPLVEDRVAARLAFDGNVPPPMAVHQTQGSSRSEEHTSELQSLMRSSYAVFCLKKQKNT